MLKVAICDDDLEFLDGVAGKIISAFEKQGYSDVKCFTYESGNAIRNKYIEDKIDVVFMDIECAGESGFNIAKDLYVLDRNLAIVYMTNHSHYITKAFVCRPLGFVCKDNLEEELKFPILNVKEYLESRKKKIVLYDGKTPIELELAGIKLIEIFGHLMEITHNNKKIRIYGSLTRYEKDLEENGFIKISRSIIINTKYVKDMNAQEVILCDGENYKISRERAKKAHSIWLASKVQ